MREVLGGGSGGRWYADGEDTIHVVPDSRNIPVEFAEARWPLRVERLGLAVDSGGPGRYRGGLGYDKHIRLLRDASFMSIADRSILSCWGVNGGRAGRPFVVTVDGVEMDGLVDDFPVRGRPDRPAYGRPAAAAGAPRSTASRPGSPQDVRDGRCLREAAREDYGGRPRRTVGGRRGARPRRSGRSSGRRARRSSTGDRASRSCRAACRTRRSTSGPDRFPNRLKGDVESLQRDGAAAAPHGADCR